MNNEDKIVITRKDGTVYYRKRKKINYDTSVMIKWKKESIEEIKKIAKKKGIKYQTLIRNVLEEYMKGEKENG